MTLPFSYTENSNHDSTSELNETEILEDTFDLLTDNEKFSDGSFDGEEAGNEELLYPIALEMVFIDWKKLDELVVAKGFLLSLLLYY